MVLFMKMAKMILYHVAILIAGLFIGFIISFALQETNSTLIALFGFYILGRGIISIGKDVLED